VQPVLALLRQGVTPDRLALTLGVGTACSLLPFFGFTTLLNLGVGAALKLNQPILHTLNQLLGPVQLALILVYVRLGEFLWGGATHPFTVGEMLAAFRDLTFADFLTRFGWAGVNALTAWVVTSPALIAAIILGTRPGLRRLAALRSA
jgi:uncharacterized protein (DUF2062 family)